MGSFKRLGQEIGMDGENYKQVRANIGLGSYDYETEQWVEREPTPAEILRLLDALHHDITGTVGPELEQARSDRYWNS